MDGKNISGYFCKASDYKNLLICNLIKNEDLNKFFKFDQIKLNVPVNRI
jgi:hypothetical protein